MDLLGSLKQDLCSIMFHLADFLLSLSERKNKS